MSRKPVVSRHTEYGVVTYSYLDIRHNKVYTDTSVFYPSDISRRKIEWRIKEKLRTQPDGLYYNFLYIDEIEHREEDLKIPIELYIVTCKQYEHEKEGGKKHGL